MTKGDMKSKSRATLRELKKELKCDLARKALVKKCCFAPLFLRPCCI